MHRDILGAVVWGGLALLLYHHVLYPLLLAGLARSRRNGAPSATATSPLPDSALPPITVIVPAYNEAQWIEIKITNLAASDYPRDKLRIVIALDGSTDDTPARAIAAAQRVATDLRFELVHYPRNIGKVAVLNDQIARAKAMLGSDGIVALTDTSASLDPDALRRAARHFASADVAFVVGRYELTDAGSEGERAHMALLARTRSDEAVLHSPIGAHGAFYALRLAQWSPLPATAINDDFLIPMRALTQGARAVYDDGIRVLELERTERWQEFRRRMRISAGNLQQSLWLLPLLAPRHGWLAWTFASGKWFRPLAPVVAVAVGLSSVWLALQGERLHVALVIALAGAVAVGLWAMATASARMPRLAAWLGYLLEGYAAALVGMAVYIANRGAIDWSRRSHAEPPPVPIVRWQSPASISSSV